MLDAGYKMVGDSPMHVWRVGGGAMAGRGGRANRRGVSSMVGAEEGRVIGRLWRLEVVGEGKGGQAWHDRPHLYNYGEGSKACMYEHMRQGSRERERERERATKRQCTRVKQHSLLAC